MSESTEGPGSALRDAREALDVTTREVADALNLPISVVEAMEADDYERLPQPVFTRGYLRSYARLLELDPAAIVARYPQALEAPLESGEQELAAPGPSRSLPVEPRVLVAAGAVALALLLAVWLWPGGETAEAPARAAAEPVPEEAPAAADAAVTEAPDSPGADLAAAPDAAAGKLPEADASRPRREPAEESPAPAAAAVPLEPEPAPEERDAAAAPGQPTLPTSASQPAAAEAPEAAAEPLEAPTPAGFRRLTPFGDDELVLTFAEDCWVQVRDLDGVNLYGDLNRAGGTLRLIGRAPFRVRLGYAPGASLELNGEAVELTRFTRNNVANVVVGR